MQRHPSTVSGQNTGRGIQVPSKPGQPTPGPGDSDLPGQQQPGQKEPGHGQPVEPDTDMDQPRL